jgi:SAM-dependent methyltransferase
MDELAYRQFLKLEQTHWWFIGRRRILFSLLDRYLPAGRELAIMDVGCGYGGMLDPLSQRGRVLGLEIDLEPAEFCRNRGYSGMLVGSGYNLPVRPASLDLVTLFDTIEHIEDDEKVLSECAGALKPGGCLMVTVPAYQFLFADNDRIAHHRRRYTLSRLKRITRSTGLEVVKGTYYNVLLFPIILPVILLLKLKQSLRGPLKEGKAGATNLSYRYPGPLRRLLEAVFSSERLLLPRISAPFGHSIALIARKRGSSCS